MIITDQMAMKAARALRKIALERALAFHNSVATGANGLSQAEISTAKGMAKYCRELLKKNDVIDDASIHEARTALEAALS